MADFQVALTFRDITKHSMPEGTNLLFYDAETKRLGRGWMEAGDNVVMVGGQWNPTHFAEHEEEVAKEAAFAAEVAACRKCSEKQLCNKHALQRHPQYQLIK